MSLYIHIPFCRSKCAYCDFYSGLKPLLSSNYVDLLLAEAQLRYDEFTEPCRTIYIGGGTPSALSYSDIGRLLAGLRNLFPLNDVEEVTIEVNPDDLTPDLIKAYVNMGINRISMGAQTFDDSMLKAIGRRHSASTALKAIDLLASSGINYSVDLIYGLPGQSVEDWSNSLLRLLQFCPPHFSAYLLSYEPGTLLYQRLMKGTVEEADEDTAIAMYNVLIRKAAENGYEHYEVSNFALPGYRSRHNSSYWDMTPYLGLGASAHSFNGHNRSANPADLRRYITLIESGQIAAEIDEETELDRLNDLIITSLRTLHGIRLDDVESIYGKQRCTALINAAQSLIASQLIINDTTHHTLYIPEEHWLRSDAIMRQLLAD